MDGKDLGMVYIQKVHLQAENEKKNTVINFCKQIIEKNENVVKIKAKRV